MLPEAAGSQTKKKSRKKTHASVTMVLDRKIQIALRTNQIVGFVTVPGWKKNNAYFLLLTKFRSRSPEKFWFAGEGLRSVHATPFSPVSGKNKNHGLKSPRLL